MGYLGMKKEIDWTNAVAKAERQLNRNKSAIESSVMGTPSNWSRPVYNKPVVVPNQSPPDEKVKKPKKLTKKQKRAHNKVFVPQQKAKSKLSSASGGIPVAKK